VGPVGCSSRKIYDPSTTDSPDFLPILSCLILPADFYSRSPIRIYVRPAVGTVATVIRNTSLSIIDPVYARALFLSSSTSMKTLIHNYLCFFKPQHSSPPSDLLQLQECLSSACAERIKCLLKVFPSEAIIQSQSIPEVPRQTVSLF
jgi:hypothetical protein